MADMNELLTKMHLATANRFLEMLEADDCSPAAAAAASKFLKDNGKIHVPESDDALEKAAEAYAGILDEDDKEASRHIQMPLRKQV